MITKIKKWSIGMAALVAIAFIFQTSTGFSAQKKFNEQAPIDGCKKSDVTTDICVKVPKNIPGCSNSLDTASWNCSATNPPAEP